MIKKSIFIFTILIWAVGLNAKGFRDSLSAKIAPVSDKYLLKTVGFAPSSQMPEGPSVWNAFISFFTSEEKEAKQQAIADYIYNMYIIDAAAGFKNNPAAQINTAHTGALDPIHRSAFRNALEIKNFYKDNLSSINKRLSDNFTQRMNIKYNPEDKENSKWQSFYINALYNTYSINNRFSYMPGKGGLNSKELSQARTAQLKKQLSVNNSKNQTLSVIYEERDPMELLDNATRLAAKTNSMKYTYRPLKEECAACTYSFCKDICATTENKYGTYKLFRVYEVYAYPKTKFLQDASGKERFTNPNGGTYPEWDYHAAALLVFEDGGGLSFTVVDTFLTKEPVSFDAWINLFNKNATYFTIKPFTRNKNTEGRIKNTKDVPSNYKPHEVRK